MKATASAAQQRENTDFLHPLPVHIFDRSKFHFLLNLFFYLMAIYFDSFMNIMIM